MSLQVRCLFLQVVCRTDRGIVFIHAAFDDSFTMPSCSLCYDSLTIFYLKLAAIPPLESNVIARRHTRFAMVALCAPGSDAELDGGLAAGPGTTFSACQGPIPGCCMGAEQRGWVSRRSLGTQRCGAPRIEHPNKF